jgi:hypothetical protein
MILPLPKLPFDVPLFIPVYRNKNLPPTADFHLRLGK